MLLDNQDDAAGGFPLFSCCCITLWHPSVVC